MNSQFLLFIWSILAILLISIMIASVLVVKKKCKHRFDYQGFFIIGIIWVLVSIFFMLADKAWLIFFIIGMVFMIIGIVNKDKWNNNQKIIK
ncbi:MAG: hypothetical protein COU72_03300 [Parcubacteria group bacterium CG10_big_fil_rev_8_21_14_0_10_41_35]|nr:MAG: hypothetical protein COU72_03300 [Parcubacteria group bacterium CG10_big_fil_rev_8_21_14_0_10_41_35]PIZ81272.1 MAG: hypothetical protein COY02_02935 [Parcubacteria group bacterium CG_4_10_14_0_2_um_filter_41_6]